MSAKDRFHDTVKTALIKDGWTITHDPLFLDFDSARIQVNLAGEKLITAERDLEKIAVEVKSFLGASTIYEFHLAVGQCFSYRIALKAQEPERQLYLAVPIFIYQDFFRRPFAQQTIQEAQLNLVTFEPTQEVISQWIN
ncbi:MAG: element excision factor XisH family protein [Cyanobacteria bacterium J06592_8]